MPWTASTTPPRTNSVTLRAHATAPSATARVRSSRTSATDEDGEIRHGLGAAAPGGRHERPPVQRDALTGPLDRHLGAPARRTGDGDLDPVVEEADAHLHLAGVVERGEQVLHHA